MPRASDRLFRGLSVGSSHRVAMADLRQLFLGCGFEALQTYIQSSNVLFYTALDTPAAQARIAGAFLQRFGFAGEVAVRSAAELASLLAGLLFSPEEITQADAAVSTLEKAVGGADKAVAGPREVYLLCRQSVRKSKFAAALVRLDPSFTARNLKTLRGVLALAAGKPPVP